MSALSTCAGDCSTWRALARSTTAGVSGVPDSEDDWDKTFRDFGKACVEPFIQHDDTPLRMYATCL